MSSSQFSIRLEKAADTSSIKILTTTVFGPAMLTRAAYALREGVSHEMYLSFVAELEGKIIGSVRLTKILWGKNPALMLGPLGVLPNYKSQGVGKALMFAAIEAAKQDVKKGGAPILMLVGDLKYYAPFGFINIPPGQIVLPRPADPNRILACELTPKSLEDYHGAATRFA